jgi:hypothetical protein
MSNFTGSSEHSGIPTKKISGDNSSTGGSRSRYAALRDRRAKVARSKSTAVVGFMGYNNDEGNLSRGIDNCSGAWYKGVRVSCTSRFSNNFSLSQLEKKSAISNHFVSFLCVLLRRKHMKTKGATF